MAVSRSPPSVHLESMPSVEYDATQRTNETRAQANRRKPHACLRGRGRRRSSGLHGVWLAHRLASSPVASAMGLKAPS
eukprot:CAMPEP_0204153646 /NCGR_PEP_ID=MMETSP0361-20130328/28033_1 /ASSEMBLY_ACC=CAM_ASM_000343 /TAXON_ID=268821 /ORGANISM="Scrippsiella Hangoei, Strain SHTV-5" /LENGTH=77 /DNA_ID=CAMNT_0051108801 /DNA_START=106 /DNA_END=336 /DNA_ORIENTATION=+